MNLEKTLCPPPQNLGTGIPHIIPLCLSGSEHARESLPLRLEFATEELYHMVLSATSLPDVPSGCQCLPSSSQERMAVAGKLQVASGSLIVELGRLLRTRAYLSIYAPPLPHGILPQEVAAELPDTWTPVL